MSDNRLYLTCDCGQSIKVASLYVGADAAKCVYPLTLLEFMREHAHPDSGPAFHTLRWATESGDPIS